MRAPPGTLVRSALDANYTRYGAGNVAAQKDRRRDVDGIGTSRPAHHTPYIAHRASCIVFAPVRRAPEHPNPWAGQPSQRQ